MNRVFAILAAAFSHFCVASVIALIAAGGTLWFKGALDRPRLYRVLAALHGIDVITMQQELISQRDTWQKEQPSYQARLEKQSLMNLDLDLRETAIDKGLQDLASLQSQLEIQEARVAELKKTYAAELQESADAELATSLVELQRTLEAIRPAQAKEQILKMLQDDAMEDVVTILKNMTLDKRKKIIAEFKPGPEEESLYEILKNIRLGEPTASRTRAAQQKLDASGGQR